MSPSQILELLAARLGPLDMIATYAPDEYETD